MVKFVSVAQGPKMEAKGAKDVVDGTVGVSAKTVLALHRWSHNKRGVFEQGWALAERAVMI